MLWYIVGKLVETTLLSRRNLTLIVKLWILSTLRIYYYNNTHKQLRTIKLNAYENKVSHLRVHGSLRSSLDASCLHTWKRREKTLIQLDQINVYYHELGIKLGYRFNHLETSQSCLGGDRLGPWVSTICLASLATWTQPIKCEPWVRWKEFAMTVIGKLVRFQYS